MTGLKGQSAKDFANYWFNNATSNSRAWWFQLDLHGGANSYISTANSSLTSYAHRDKLYIIQFYDRTFFGDYPANGFDFLDKWVNTTISSLKADDWGMYINYADARMTRDVAQKAYWGKNLRRLQQVKSVYDPNEVFYYPISVQPVA